ncbi:MAG: putative sulfate exporter family transporter [Kofleriaceae bacterium]
MALPRWLPKRSDLPGLGLVGALGLGAIALTRALPRTPLLSEVLVAMLLGALVLNTPLAALVGARGGAADRCAGGVAYACTWLLRLAIILMGLKVQTSAIGGADLLLVLLVCATAIPSAFFVAQLAGARLGLRQPFTDLLAAGSMICGASAVNATAPIVGAERQEQGLAIGIVFLSSVGAMLTFHAIAHALALPAAKAGLWAGLSVNDLSSAVAVGIQMGGDGGVTAAAAKSTRILMMAPMLVALALLRRPRAESAPGTLDASLRKSIVASLPRFILGYLALGALRVTGDHLWGSSALWHAALDQNKVVVEVLMAMIASGIGLNLAFSTLLSSSARGVVASVLTSAFMAASTLAMVTAAHQRGLAAAAGVGAAALAATFFLYRALGARRGAAPGGAPPVPRAATDPSIDRGLPGAR